MIHISSAYCAHVQYLTRTFTCQECSAHDAETSTPCGDAYLQVSISTSCLSLNVELLIEFWDARLVVFSLINWASTFSLDSFKCTNVYVSSKWFQASIFTVWSPLANGDQNTFEIPIHLFIFFGLTTLHMWGRG